MMLVHCGVARLFALKYSASSTRSAVIACCSKSNGTSRIGSHSSACSTQPTSTSRLRPT